MMSITKQKDTNASLALLGLAAFLSLAVTVAALLFLRSTYNKAMKVGPAQAVRFTQGTQHALGRSD